MGRVHDKAPPRKKEDKPTQAEAQRKFQGPKTGPHGEHVFVPKEGGGWACTKCAKFSTTHLGWKRLVRRPCQAKEKTNRLRWKRSYHRRKWSQRAANKLRRGDLTANHVPLSVIEDGQAKWLCTSCGKLAKRPTDLGSGCSGTPFFGATRYWRKNKSRLADHAAGRALTAGRNKPRTGTPNQPEEPGRILRCLAQAQAVQVAPQPSAGVHPQEEERLAPRPQQAPQSSVPAPGRTRPTASQELARLFGTPRSAIYTPSQEDFPALPGIREASHSSSKAPGQGQQLGPQRPRSRSPRTAAWQGHSHRRR